MKTASLLVATLLLSGCASAPKARSPERSISHTDPAAEYEAQTGCRKLDVLWEKVLATSYRGEPGANDRRKRRPGFASLGPVELVQMRLQGVGHKIRHPSDFAPDGWVKYLHRRGSLVRVRLVPKGDRYTGAFRGAECALLRLSLTFKPAPVAPGLALKVLRDSVHSGNVSALVSLEGQKKDYFFFRSPLTTIVPQGTSFGTKRVHEIFATVTQYPEELLSEDLARFDARGREIPLPVPPRQLFFVPDPSFNFSKDKHDVRDDFKRIPIGTTIYRIEALSPDGKTREPVADLITTSDFVASEFGDDGIFFRHQARP